MFANWIRSNRFVVGSATCALLVGCAACSAQDNSTLPARVQSVTVGQGGFYSVVIPATVEAAPYALTGARQGSSQTSIAGTVQNYGQSTLFIPSVLAR